MVSSSAKRDKQTRAAKTRVLYILHQYPQISESYIEVEIRNLRPDYEIHIISTTDADHPIDDPHPFTRLDTREEIREFIRTLGPDLIHTHWLSKHLHIVCPLARELGIPYTVRSHSFDTLWRQVPWYKRMFSRRHGAAAIDRYVEYLNDDLCLGLVSFPFSIPRLERVGVKREKMHPCHPVVDFDLFADKGPNGDAVLNVGACLPKKNHADFIDLASKVPERTFNLYPLGYKTERIKRMNLAAGSPVEIKQPVQLHEMRSVYKQHRWLVYTACPKLATVGWPIAVAEAQAAGVGVCLQNVRPDLKDYIGDSGILFSSVAELVDLVKNPVPDEMRQKGFENARKSDFSKHRHLLTDLWERR